MGCFDDGFAKFVRLGDRFFQEHGFDRGDIDVGKKKHEDEQDKAGGDRQFENKADAQVRCTPKKRQFLFPLPAGKRIECGSILIYGKWIVKPDVRSPSRKNVRGQGPLNGTIKPGMPLGA
jgi:hypothetical protein